MHLELINLELNLNSSRITLEKKKKKSQTFINLELILNITNYAE